MASGFSLENGDAVIQGSGETGDLLTGCETEKDSHLLAGEINQNMDSSSQSECGTEFAPFQGKKLNDNEPTKSIDVDNMTGQSPIAMPTGQGDTEKKTAALDGDSRKLFCQVDEHMGIDEDNKLADAGEQGGYRAAVDVEKGSRKTKLELEDIQEELKGVQFTGCKHGKTVRDLVNKVDSLAEQHALDKVLRDREIDKMKKRLDRLEEKGGSSPEI